MSFKNIILGVLLLFFSCTKYEYVPKSNGEIVKHNYYILSYLEDFEQAEWVYYVLTPKMLRGRVRRTNDFRVDTKVSTGSASNKDYKYSGYDRGHLAPAGDMKISNLAMNESFLYSNISPQSPLLNRDKWKSLETLVREWASEEKIHVVTGGILVSGLQEIGNNGVDVPKYFYKIIYSPNKDKMIAFILPNEKCKMDLKEYVVTVDKVEELTNIDFFPQLVDEIEENLESKIDFTNWTF